MQCVRADEKRPFSGKADSVSRNVTKKTIVCFCSHQHFLQILGNINRIYNLQSGYIRRCHKRIFQVTNGSPFVAAFRENTGRHFKMFKLCCVFLCVVLIVQVSRACNDGNDEQLAEAAAREQESVEYWANAYGFAPDVWILNYHQPSNVQSKQIITVFIAVISSLQDV